MRTYLWLLLAAVSLAGAGPAFAEPLESVSAVVLGSGETATVQLSWDGSGASYYEAGCVSCVPNTSETTVGASVVLGGVVPLSDGSALLYVVAYDEAGEILDARQVVVDLG